MCEGNTCHGHEGDHSPRKSDCHRDPCCCGFERRFATKEEKVARLSDYLKELQAEALAVEERIKELKESK